MGLFDDPPPPLRSSLCPVYSPPQELSENMGLKNLRERFNDPYMAEVFQGMFPTDNPRNTRFAINFFTAIGLGGLTDGLRLHLKNAPKMIMEAQVGGSGPVQCDGLADNSQKGNGNKTTATITTITSIFFIVYVLCSIPSSCKACVVQGYIAQSIAFAA